ncbi:MAG: acyclic terpene utilization AtuA family protein, partial [Candidatus Hydrogenedentes bacterium]|nr:acyclic terpene utilization AtuA family protein [Candidatus Hydrogenedentota bacterium]
SPDVTVSFLTLNVQEEGENRVGVRGATGSEATDFYKVSATHRDGYWTQGNLTIFGHDAVAKARRCGEIVLDRLGQAGCSPARSNVECLGTGASVAGMFPEPEGLLETVLRISVADPRREVVERFSKELAPLITAGPQGVTGYAAGRPRVQPVFGYWPCLIEKTAVEPVVEVFEV